MAWLSLHKAYSEFARRGEWRAKASEFRCAPIFLTVFSMALSGQQ